jgi:predicted phage tail protein
LNLRPDSSPVRPLRQILAADATLARWAERQQRDQGVLQQLQKQLPPALAAQVRAVSAGAQELILIATSGAAAALLRHRAPALRVALEHGGWKFTVIRVRVQARSLSDRTRQYLPKQMDSVSAARLRAGARELADPRLREALVRLADAAERATQRNDSED